MARSEQSGEILKRALGYPYRTPQRSFVQLGARVLELAEAGFEAPGALTMGTRAPLLAYGANAAPEALARKLATLPQTPLPVVRTELNGFDVVYSAHVSPYGAVPATLHPSPGTVAPVFVLYPNQEQRALLAATELNYELIRLAGGATLTEVDAFLSRHGCLSLAGAPVALAAIRSSGRTFAELDEAAVLDRVRARHSPDLDLEAFVTACVASGGVAPLPELWGP